MLVTAAGLSAGLLAWGVGEVFYDYFPAKKEKTIVNGAVFMLASGKSVDIAHRQNATVAFAIFGGLLGVILGMTGGYSRRAPIAGISAGMFGLIVGSALGAGMTTMLTPILFEALTRMTNGVSTGQDDFITPIWVHSLIWGSLGASAGLALGLGRGGGKGVVIRATFAGFMGAVLGTVVFELIGAELFPLEKTTHPLALGRWSRLLARLLVALPAALLAARELTPAAPRAVVDTSPSAS